MAERARLGEGRERVSEVGCVAPGGVGLSSGAEGRRVGRGKALDQRRLAVKGSGPPPVKEKLCF